MNIGAWKLRKLTKLPKLLKKEVSLGGAVPRGWRMAWYEPRRHVGVYYPAPLNRIMRWLREARYRMRIALGAPRIEASQFFAMQRLHQRRLRMADEYARGYMIGWRECFQACVEAIEDEMSSGNDVWEIGALLTEGGKAPRREN